MSFSDEKCAIVLGRCVRPLGQAGCGEIGSDCLFEKPDMDSASWMTPSVSHSHVFHVAAVMRITVIKRFEALEATRSTSPLAIFTR